jgi:hypothetical protein
MPQTKDEDTGGTDPAGHWTLKPSPKRHVASQEFPKGGERIYFIHPTNLTGCYR